MSCVLDREIDEQTGRCLKCGHQVVKASAEPKADRNAGAPARSPSQAYRDPLAPFDRNASVAAVNGLAPAAVNAAIAEKPAIADVPAPHPTPEARDARPPAEIPPSAASAGAPSAAWFTETRALAQSFIAAAESAEQHATDATAQAAKFKGETAALRRSAAVFTQLLGQVPAGLTADEKPHKTGTLPPGAWSLKHARCIDCGTSERPHVANGRCRICDGKWRAGKAQ
jgi:hypothetical protein